MKALFRYFSFRHAKLHPFRVALGALAIALGVALYVSVDAANATMIQSFERSVADLSGKAELQVTTKFGIGVDAGALTKLTGLPGVVAAPVIQRSITFRDLADPQVMILAVDFQRESTMREYSVESKPDPREFAAMMFVPNAIVLTKRFAAKNGIVKGRKLDADTPRGRRTLIVTGLMDDTGPAQALDGNVGVLTIAAAQEMFDLKGRFDRIDVAREGISAEELFSKTSAALGKDYEVRPVSKTSTAVTIAVERLKSMIVVSAIALVVGLFIIYNSVSISVVERAREIGILRSIGATRRQILATILTEWIVVGFIGSAGGVAGGFLLARIFVKFAAHGANQLAFAVKVQEVEFAWPGALIALAAGTLTATGAALLPGVAAMRITPIGLIREASYRMRAAPRYIRSFAIGVGMLGTSSIALAAWGRTMHPNLILFITTLAFFAFALCGPQLTLWAARATRPLLRRLFRIEGYLAADSLAKFPQRTALTVAAFGGAITMMIATASVVGGFRKATDTWMETAFPFDLSVNATDLSQAFYSQAAYGEDVLEAVRKVEGVERAYGARSTLVPFGYDVEIMVVAIDTVEFFDMHRAKGTKGGPLAIITPEIHRSLLEGRGIMVSSNLAELDNRRAGDQLYLPTPQGHRPFEILGAVDDYSWPAGTVLMDRGAYKSLWGDNALNYVNIRLTPGADPAVVRSRVAESLKDKTTIFVYSVPELQAVAQSAMDQALALSHVQVLIALVIGFLGIVNTLLISVLLRTREIGLLRAVGTTRRQVFRGVVIEAVFIAIAGSAVGVAAGLAGASWPIRLFILSRTGFWFPFVVPWQTLAIAAGVGALLGVLASLIPARRASRLNVLEAIAYE